MAGKEYEYRKEWNSRNYTQIKAAVSNDLADAFKAACKANDKPVRQVLISLMQEYAHVPPKVLKTASQPDYSTRGKRRSAAAELLSQLQAILEAEEQYRNGIPESMSNRIENADVAIEALTEAIGLLEDVL